MARLLDLNQKRHEEEVLGGKHAEGKQKKTTTTRKTKQSKTSNSEANQLQLLDNE